MIDRTQRFDHPMFQRMEHYFASEIIDEKLRALGIDSYVDGVGDIWYMFPENDYFRPRVVTGLAINTEGLDPEVWVTDFVKPWDDHCTYERVL